MGALVLIRGILKSAKDTMMSPLELLMLLSRWLHILAAITAVGGTIFARTVVMPAQSVLSADQQQALQTAMRNRWSKIVAASIGFLLFSGLFNFIMTVHDYTVPRWYHMLFGAKFLLAMGIFLIASLLSGKTAAAERLRTQARFWMNVNIVLAVVLVCISGVLRTADKKPRVQTAAPALESRQPA